MELTACQKEILVQLERLAMPREDIFAVMLMLSREDKAASFLEAIRSLDRADPDDLRRLCGRIAFGGGPDEGK